MSSNKHIWKIASKATSPGVELWKCRLCCATLTVAKGDCEPFLAKGYCWATPSCWGLLTSLPRVIVEPFLRVIVEPFLAEGYCRAEGYCWALGLLRVIAEPKVIVERFLPCWGLLILPWAEGYCRAPWAEGYCWACPCSGLLWPFLAEGYCRALPWAKGYCWAFPEGLWNCYLPCGGLL